jgi:hypothetical protein
LGKSHDSILSFQWTTEVSDDPENAAITKDVRDKVAGWRAPQQKSLTFVALSSVKVTLTVSDRDLKDSKDVQVKVRLRVDVRLFETTVTLLPPYRPGKGFTLVDRRERWWPGARLARGAISLEAGRYPLGKNACTLCTPADGDPPKNKHFIHAAAWKSPSWDWEDEKHGFTLAQLEDPGAAFHQFYYVRQRHLFMDRTVLINGELADIGPIYKENRPRVTKKTLRPSWSPSGQTSISTPP